MVRYSDTSTSAQRKVLAAIYSFPDLENGLSILTSLRAREGLEWALVLT